MHRDHYTQALAVRREFGSHVSLGLGEKPTLDVVRNERLTRDPTVPQILRAGAEEVAREWADTMSDVQLDLALWEDPDTWLEGDHRLTVGSRTLDAVATPGHTQGHFVFADLDAGLLFAGDHVLPTITPSIGFEPAYADQPLGDFLASLAKVRAMPDLRLLPAHGAVTGSTHARVDELVAHHDERLAAVPGVGAGRAGRRRTTSRPTCPGPAARSAWPTSTCSTRRSRRWRRWRTSTCSPRGARSPGARTTASASTGP